MAFIASWAPSSCGGPRPLSITTPGVGAIAAPCVSPFCPTAVRFAARFSVLDAARSTSTSCPPALLLMPPCGASFRPSCATRPATTASVAGTSARSSTVPGGGSPGLQTAGSSTAPGGGSPDLKAGFPTRRLGSASSRRQGSRGVLGRRRYHHPSAHCCSTLLARWMGGEERKKRSKLFRFCYMRGSC